ncbi:sensor domain-containing diguanylate cyclase, partial [bacterium]|nr:sensor domain-containing diguanylate cyclase [bacterium]
MSNSKIPVNVKKELKQKSADLRLLLKLSTQISSAQKRRTLYNRIVKLFAEVAQTEKSSLMLFNEKTNRLHIVAGIGISKEAKRRLNLRIGEGIAGQVAQTGKFMMINDTVGNSRYKPLPIKRKPVHKTESLLAVPLITKGKVIGVITVSNKVLRQPFIRNDRILLGTLASQAAIAIENARLYIEAITDGLTGLYIHTYFQRRLTEEIERLSRHPAPLALLMVDVDYFKKFNDTYGHQEGDCALRNIARILKKNVRSGDLVARYGGEEFAITTHHTNHSNALNVAQRLRREVNRFDLLVGKKRVKVSISIGVAVWKPGIDKEELINQADQALYR